MTRRERIKAGMRGGGTTTPRGRGRQQQRKPTAETRDAVHVNGKIVGGSRVRYPGGKGFVPNPKVAAARGRKRPNRKGKGRERIKAGLAKGRPARGGGRAGLQNRAQAGLGRQLTRRVDSGAISQEQAQQTLGERQRLQEAYGDDWRAEVYGDRGYMQRTRLAAAENPEDERVQALLAMLLERRRRMLEQAMEEGAA